MKNVCFVRLSWLSAALCGSVLAATCRAAEISDLRSVVAWYGGSLTVESTGVYKSTGTGAVDKLFDGKYKTTNDRILITKPSAGNPSVTVTIADLGTAGTGVRLNRVDLYPLARDQGKPYALRMPTEYKVYGIDAGGVEHELCHPSELTYPDTTTKNAPEGTYFSTDIPPSQAAEAVYNKFKIEFLGSGEDWTAAAGSILLGFMEISLKVEVVSDMLYGETDFARLLRGAGYTTSQGKLSADWVCTTNVFSSTGNAANAFDGHTILDDSIDSNWRWMGYLSNGGTFVEIRSPNAYRPGDVFVLKGFRLWSLSNSDPANLTRAPTEWKLFGTDETTAYWKDPTEENWNLVLSRSGQDWSGVTVATGKNTLGIEDAKGSDGRYHGFRAFRFRPLDSVEYQKGGSIHVGLFEVELRVMAVNRPGSLRVFVDVEGCHFGACPADGDLVTASQTVSAPKYAFKGADAYLVKGYHVESYDYEKGEWIADEFVASRSYAYSCDANASERIFWELEPAEIGDWTVTEDGDVCHLTDGNFDLQVDAAALAEGKLTYADKSWLVDGIGILDFSKPITKSGAAVTIREIDLPQLDESRKSLHHFTKIVLPPTLERIVCSAFRDQKDLTELVIDCPELTEIGGALFTRDTALVRVVFKAPKLTSIRGDYLFYSVPMDETDANDWQLDSLATMEKSTYTTRFYEGEWTEPHGFHGTLSLPSIVNVGYSDFAAQKNVTNVVLGAASASLNTIGGISFQDAINLESLTIGCGKDLVVNNAAFAGCAKLKDVTFLKYAPSAAGMDQILTNNTAEARANVYVSPNRRQWTGFVQAIDESKDPNPPSGAVGVYETANGVRKAWIFHKESPLDRIGLTVIIR